MLAHRRLHRERTPLPRATVGSRRAHPARPLQVLVPSVMQLRPRFAAASRQAAEEEEATEGSGASRASQQQAGLSTANARCGEGGSGNKKGNKKALPAVAASKV